MKQSFIVRFPQCLVQEMQYSLRVIFEEFLGVDFNGVGHNNNSIEIELEGYQEKLSINNDFFNNGQTHWKEINSLPKVPLLSWNPRDSGIDIKLTDKFIPVIFGKPGFVNNSESRHLNLDVFGSAFFLLSRYEELVSAPRDEHDRFPVEASLAYREGFLERPILDEYIEILWACMKMIWPDIIRKQHRSQVYVSCDVDVPFDPTINNVTSLLRVCLGDLVKRKSPIEALKRFNRFCFNRLGIYKFDPMYTFDWYMDVCEKYNLQAAFYFIPDSSEPNNGCYQINEPRILNLMKNINHRGHEIGVHGSYYTYQNLTKLKEQIRKLREVVANINSSIDIIGNRQHYLRWDSLKTPEYLDLANIKYDTTGSFAEAAGFKYGTSKEFTMWGWSSNAPLSIKQRPLIVMECSIIADKYSGLGYTDEAMRKMLLLKKRALMFGGNFTILWHNSHFLTVQDKVFFEAILK